MNKSQKEKKFQLKTDKVDNTTKDGETVWNVENGVDIGFWPALSADRHLERLAGTTKRTFFPVFNEFRRVADQD